MYDIRYDAAARLLNVRMTGFWTMDEVERFAADLLALIGTIPEADRAFDVLSDSSDFPVQAQDVADVFARIMTNADLYVQGRRAVVVGSMMNKLQAQRALSGPNVRVFLSDAEARAWLRSPLEDPGAILPSSLEGGLPA